MAERDNITLAWRIVLTGTRAALLTRASPGPPTLLPDKRDLSDLEEDFRELGIPIKCLPRDENIHLSTVSSGTIELIWPDRPARSALFTDLKSFFHKARPDKVTKRLIGAVMMYCLPPSTTNLQHISMDFHPIAMFADPDFNPDLWNMRREVLKHQKKSFTSPPPPSQMFQPGTSEYLSSFEQPIRQIKRESPSDADAVFGGGGLSNDVSVVQQRRLTPSRQLSDPFFRASRSYPGLPVFGTGTGTGHDAREARADFRVPSIPGGITGFARSAGTLDSSGDLNARQYLGSSDLNGLDTVIPRKRAFSDAEASQNEHRPSHAFELDQDRDLGHMRRNSYSSDSPRDADGRRTRSDHDNTRTNGRSSGRDHGDRSHPYGRPRNGSESHRRRGSGDAAIPDIAGSSRQIASESARMANGRRTPTRLTDTLDRILASPSFAQKELDSTLPDALDATQDQEGNASPEPKLSSLDIMALKAKIPRIEAERDAARQRARKLEDDLAAARHGAGRGRGLEDEVASWRARAEDAVYRSDELAVRLKRLLAGEIPDSLNPNVDEAITLLGHVLNRMRRDIAQAETERARYDSLSRDLENLVAHRDTIPPLIEALQQIADATKNIRLPQ